MRKRLAETSILFVSVVKWFALASLAGVLVGATPSPYAAVVCIVSFLMVGHRSVYPSQILAMTKSASLTPEIGKTVEDMHEIVIASRDESIVGVVRKIARKLRETAG